VGATGEPVPLGVGQTALLHPHPRRTRYDKCSVVSHFSHV
jgi:hypothetical protein